MIASGDLDRLLARLEVEVVEFGGFEGERLRTLGPAASGLLRIVFVLKGPVILGMSGRPAQRCGAGTIALLPPDCTAQLRPCDANAAMQIATGLVSARLSDTIALLERANVPLIEAFGRSELMRHACLALLSLADEGDGHSGALAGALMKTCILATLRRFLRRPGIDHKIASALADPRLSAAIAAILDRPAAAHSLDNLAARANVARSTFARLFAGAMGQSPMEFVIRIRLFHAAKMLAHTPAPVKAVAADVGFASRSHFSRAFSEVFGCDPTSYRQARAGAEANAPVVQDLRALASGIRPGAAVAQ